LNDQTFEISKLKVMMTLMQIVNKATHRSVRPVWICFVISLCLFPRPSKKQ